MGVLFKKSQLSLEEKELHFLRKWNSAEKKVITPRNLANAKVVGPHTLQIMFNAFPNYNLSGNSLRGVYYQFSMGF